jgi:hypothetical protein
LLVSLNLALVGGSPAPLPDAEVPDFVRLRELRTEVPGTHSELIANWQGSTNPSFLAQVPAEVLNKLPLSVFLDRHVLHDNHAEHEAFSSTESSSPPELYSVVPPSVEGHDEQAEVITAREVFPSSYGAGLSDSDIRKTKARDTVSLRLRENTKLGDHSEDDDVGTWQGSTEPSFLAQVPDHVLDNIPLTALLDVGADSDSSSASLSPPPFLYSLVSPSEEVDTGNLDIYSEQFSSASQNSRSGGATGSYVGVDIAASGNAWGQSSAGTSVAPNRGTNNVRNIVNCSSSSNENSNFITYNMRRSAHSHDARSGAANLAPGSSSSRALAGAFVRASQADAHNPFLSGSLNLSTSGASAGMYREETGTSPPQFS